MSTTDATDGSSCDDSADQDMEISEDSTIRDFWKEFDGDMLEPFLKNGESPIVLLHAEWLVNFARKEEGTAIISYRQDLPDKAFRSLEQLKETADESVCLPVIALSYMWLRKDHPDPKGETLQRLVNALEHLKETGDDSILSYGIFWDYASLYQHPDPQKGIRRTPEEERVFQEALRGLAFLYSHEHVTIFQFTDFPLNYPDHYGLPSGTVCVPYSSRGWPYFESCLAALKSTYDGTKVVRKSFANEEDNNNDHNNKKASLDVIVQADTARRLPVIPRKFYRRLRKCTFTNRKSDLRLVRKLYHEFFEDYFKFEECLNYYNLGWSDGDVELFMRDIIDKGYAKRITDLDLSQNQIGLAGCESIARRVLSGGLPHLNLLSVSLNPIGDAGCSILAPVLVGLEDISLEDTGIGNDGCQSLARAIMASPPKLKNFSVASNPKIGNSGFQALLSIFDHCQDTIELFLVENGASAESIQKLQQRRVEVCRGRCKERTFQSESST